MWKIQSKRKIDVNCKRKRQTALSVKMTRMHFPTLGKSQLFSVQILKTQNFYQLTYIQCISIHYWRTALQILSLNTGEIWTFIRGSSSGFIRKPIRQKEANQISGFIRQPCRKTESNQNSGIIRQPEKKKQIRIFVSLRQPIGQKKTNQNSGFTGRQKERIRTLVSKTDRKKRIKRHPGRQKDTNQISGFMRQPGRLKKRIWTLVSLNS